MKYLLFAGGAPRGGWRDLHGAFEKRETAIHIAESILNAPRFTWSHVVDVLTHEKIWDSTGRKE